MTENHENIQMHVHDEPKWIQSMLLFLWCSLVSCLQCSVYGNTGLQARGWRDNREEQGFNYILRFYFHRYEYKQVSKMAMLVRNYFAFFQDCEYIRLLFWGFTENNNEAKAKVGVMVQIKVTRHYHYRRHHHQQQCYSEININFP